MQQSLNITLTLTVSSLLTVTTTVLPGATVGQAYSFQMAVTGGVSPYTWSASGLPPGLSVSSSGLITGTPTAGGNYSVTMTVIDSGT